MVYSVFKSLPFRLVLLFGAVFFFGHLLPLAAVRAVFTASLLFKNLLMSVLPFLIFSYVTTGILALRKNAPLVLALIMVTVLVSNGIVGMITYGTTLSLLSWLVGSEGAIGLAQASMTIEPYFYVDIPLTIRSEFALLAALITGNFLTWYRIPTAEIAINRLKKMINFVIKKMLLPFLPLYVGGFLLKIQLEGALQSVMAQYSKTFLLMIVAHWVLLSVWYFVSQKGVLSAAWQKLVNALPSYLTALGTMSSTATIPVTLQSAENNEVHPGLAHVAIPLLANIHLLGDAVSVPLLALVTKMLFMGTIPSLGEYLLFLGYFVVSMLAVAGIPGGGIMVMIPVLQSMFNFSPDMISLITALYLMQDPFGTAANVMGDGALVMIIENVAKRLKILE